VSEIVLELDNVGLTIDGRTVLQDLSLQVLAGQRWVVLGPNGGGKSTLMRIAGLALHPTVGDVHFLANTLGRCDIRPLRARIGTSSAALVDALRPELSARDVVKCGVYGALEPWWHTYSDDHHDRADGLLAQVGLLGFEQRRFGSLSSGERQRAMLARGLMPQPDLLLLDEPMAGLDLGGREELIHAMDSLGPDGPATLFVTHHVEDIPQTFQNLLGIGRNGFQAQGAIAETLTPELIEDLFDVQVSLSLRNGRWSASL
jgi:iron complex transport system ATP-binding protein